MGRAAAGVRGAELEDADDEVVGMVAVSRPDAEILVVTERGFGKRTPIDDYRLTARGTKGVLTIKTTERNGRIVEIKEVVDADELMIITRKGVLIRQPVSGISQLGRATQGVHLIRLEEGDEVAAVAHVAREEEVGVNGEGADEGVDDNAAADTPLDSAEEPPDDEPPSP
jgi:DNA gyrase subunit A